MSIRRLRARIEKLEAAYFRQSRMAELISNFKTGDLTEEEDKEALSLDRSWPATKASMIADWDRQYKDWERQHEEREQLERTDAELTKL